MRDRVLVEVAGQEPAPFVSLQEVKQHLRLEGADDDDYLEQILIPAACGLLDGANGLLGRALSVQQWDLILGPMWHSPRGNEPAPLWAPWWAWHGSGLGQWGVRIPLPPLREIIEVRYRDASGAYQVLPADQYTVPLGLPEPVLLTMAQGLTWPTFYNAPDALVVRFEAGYDPAVAADPDADPPVAAIPTKVPARARMAALLQAARLYQNRENPPNDLAGAALTLVQPLRVLK
jgi:hypothetical protein